MVNRFYKDVSLAEQDNMFRVQLDGRTAKTAGRIPLGAAGRDLAATIAEEWAAQGEELDMSTMPLTRLQGFVLDGGDRGKAEWSDKILAFAQADLLCYRSNVGALAARQATHWQPVLDYVGGKCGAAFAVTDTIMAVEQPTALLDGIAARLADEPTGVVLALKLITEILGSAALALALLDDEVGVRDAFQISRVDDHYQQEQWGVDEAAAAREVGILDELISVERFMRLSCH
ncbi:ATP12 family protein [Parvularcula sp. LCG005]|uniref:ATP12 family protein n=1 Tax=Parvularcula sp. LCG005 TaxID=3078805 RepID=UPI0029439E8F|nr:ATP12 family protein [Parvularcula sp. LCG005]WOI52484.1 ATP12 family protein [Parvularcula sp. LCG005]